MKHNDEGMQERSQQQLDREALSALMDSELSDFELRRLLRRVEQRPELLAIWERFGLIRAALQPDPLQSPLSPDFASRVMAEVDQSIKRNGLLSSVAARVIPPRHTGPTGWARNTTRFAVAASVTFAVFMGMQAVLQHPGAVDSQPAVASGNSTQSALSDNRQLAVDVDAQKRLNDYIRAVTIPARVESQSTPYNVLLDSPQLRPVADRELLEQVERDPRP